MKLPALLQRGGLPALLQRGGLQASLLGGGLPALLHGGGLHLHALISFPDVGLNHRGKFGNSL